MLKIKNKFIIFIISLIVLIISSGILKSYIDYKTNSASFAILVNGEATINNDVLDLNTKIKLHLGDNIKTIGEESLLVLEWGDGSITRLGGNTSVKIEELYVSNDNGIINISISLVKGKTWSNIVSFLGDGSHFKEFFRDNEAAVRGTIFNIDLDKNYLNVVDHKVTLTNTEGTEFLINENNILDISNFSFLALDDFIKSFKDINWEKSNNLIDKDLFAGLKIELYKELDDINKFKDINLKNILSDVNAKKDLYNELLNDYQKLNFIKPDEEELFKTKLELKATLIKLANNTNKTKLVENTLYDFKEIVDLEEFGNLDYLIKILSDNKELLIDFELEEYLDIESIPESIQNSIFKDLDIFTDTLGNNLTEVDDLVDGTINNAIDDTLEDVNTLGDTLTEVNGVVDKTINNAIDDTLDNIDNALDFGTDTIEGLFNK